MSIATASILKDGTVSATGGTAAPFQSLGSTLQEHKCAFDGDDIRTRSECVFSTKPPTVKGDAPNGYSQARNTAFIKVPLVLDNGSITVNTVQISLARDVETSPAEIQTMLSYAAQVLTDSDFTDFWEDQAVG